MQYGLLTSGDLPPQCSMSAIVTIEIPSAQLPNLRIPGIEQVQPVQVDSAHVAEGSLPTLALRLPDNLGGVLKVEQKCDPKVELKSEMDTRVIEGGSDTLQTQKAGQTVGMAQIAS